MQNIQARAQVIRDTLKSRLPDTLVVVLVGDENVEISVECVVADDDHGVQFQYATHILSLKELDAFVAPEYACKRIADKLAHRFDHEGGERIALTKLRGHLAPWRDRCAQSRGEMDSLADVIKAVEQERRQQQRAKYVVPTA